MKHIFVFVLLFTIASTNSFVQIHTEREMMAYFQSHSIKPLLHTYYNRHFKNSSKFRQFQASLQQVYSQNSDYFDILMTDCDLDKQHKLTNCNKMAKTKDNKQITGTVPMSQFRRVGNLLVQSPPRFHSFTDRSKEQYSQEELTNMIRSLLPNFYQPIINKESYQDFLQPKYSPKMIVFIDDEQELMPLALRQIAIANFLKMDFGYVTDLTDDVISLFEVKKYPSFVIVTYNFNTSTHEYHYYQDNDFSDYSYQKVKKFVNKFALSEPRNDLLFHKVQMEIQSEIITIETQAELQQQKEKSNGWLIIANSDGKIPQKLAVLHSKYGRYFSYINYVQQPIDHINIYNPSQKFVFPSKGELEFNALDYEDFKSNLTVWLHKDIIVMGIAEEYAYICGLTEKVLFRGHVRCLIISKEHQKQIKQFMKNEFQIGFIIRSEGPIKDDGSRETTGVKISTTDYETVYKDLEYSTRMKIKEQFDDFLNNPVRQIRKEMSLGEICSHPIKKCIFLLTQLNKKDRTFQQYLKEIAFDYLNNIIIYEMDIASNPQFLKIIGGIKNNKADLIGYNFNKNQYVRLNKKLSRPLIKQFITAFLKDDKRLKKQIIELLPSIVIRRNEHSKQQKSEEL